MTIFLYGFSKAIKVYWMVFCAIHHIDFWMDKRSLCYIIFNFLCNLCYFVSPVPFFPTTIYWIKVQAITWLVHVFRYVNLKAFVVPFELSAWHIQNMLFVKDPERQPNKRPILLGHLFLFTIQSSRILQSFQLDPWKMYLPRRNSLME